MWFSASRSILDNVLETLVAEKRQTPIQTVTIPMYPHTRPGPPPSASSTFSAEEVGVEVVVGVVVEVVDVVVEEEEEDHIRVRTMEPPIKRKSSHTMWRSINVSSENPSSFDVFRPIRPPVNAHARNRNQQTRVPCPVSRVPCPSPTVRDNFVSMVSRRSRRLILRNF